MKKIIPLFALIAIIAASGCIFDSDTTTATAGYGLEIIDFSTDLVEVFGDKTVRLTMAVENQGENSTILLKAIYVCYHNCTERPNMIPCYAERASLNGTEVWAIAFNSALGYGGSISHEDMWFISIPMIEDGSYLVAPLSPILCWSGSD